MKRRTKIICTMGPAVSDYATILDLIRAGMNVARLNFSHGTHASHQEMIDKLKRAREELKVPLAIMLDTKGPEIRVGVLNKEISVQQGQRVLLVSKAPLDDHQIPVTPAIALESLSIGDLVLFDDGYIGSKVMELTSDGVIVEFLNRGIIKSQKGINLPHVNVPLPALTEQDIKDIRFGCQQDVELIAASFIRSADHIRQIKSLLLEMGKPEIQIIAKIENGLGVQNFDSIIQVTDGVMIARGDLGVELPIEEVPVLQKMMIRKCIQHAKPVVIATQMLESMINNPRPTRAEASDVANATYDSTSAVMLSGETAIGKYPVETVNTMCRIVEAAEADFPFRLFFQRDLRIDSHDISSSISAASVKTAYSSGARAIFAFTSSGSTARLISSYRPEMPILALTPHPKIYHQLAFNWGVIPVPPSDAVDAHEALEITSLFARERQIVQFGDIVVVTAGVPFGYSGTTNMMIVESIGEVLVRGNPSEGKETTGTISIVLTPDDYSERAAKEKIVVLSKFDEDYREAIKTAKGIILQNHPEDRTSEAFALEEGKRLGIPVIVRADEAVKRLFDGQIVTMDPERGTVYKKGHKNFIGKNK